MTNALAGYKALMTLSTATGQSKTTLAELRDYSLSVEHAEIDATSHDSSGDREIIAGVGSWSATADVLHVQTEETVQEAVDVLLGRTKIDMEFIPTGSSSDGTFSGSGYLTNYELGAPNEDALNASVSVQGSGALTRNSSA